MSGASSATLDELRIARLDEADDNGKLFAEFGKGGARLRAVAITIRQEINLVNEDMLYILRHVKDSNVESEESGWLMISCVSSRS